MPVDVSEIVRKERENWKALQEDKKFRKKRDQEKRKKELEESEKEKIGRESHSEEYQTLLYSRINLIKVMPGGALDSGMINLLLGNAFDKIRDLEREVKELKEIRQDIRELEIKISGKEIDSFIENLEKTPG